MHKNLGWMTACVLISAALPAAAVPLRGLYEASVPVPDQSVKSREPALQQALQAVLIRATGNRRLPPENTGPLLVRASGLVQGYGYESGPQGLRLKAQFDARAVEAALRSQGLPVWGMNRLSHLSWIALQGDGQPRVVLDAAAASIRAGALLETAEARGIPLSFPKMDATDRQLVNFNQVWSGDFAGLQGAARRYKTDLILIGRVGRENDRWISRWTLLNDDGTGEEWFTSQSSLELALAEGMHELADRQARRFAVQTGSAQELSLSITGIASLTDYGRVLNYLRNLNSVRATHVETLSSSAVTFRLQVEGDSQVLTRVIAAGNVLRKQDSGVFGPELSYALVH